MEILRYNDYQTEDSEFLQDALIYGTAAELMYMDNESHVRFKLINPLNCFGVFDDSLTNDLLYFVRWYKKNEWEENNLYCLDLYDNTMIKHYELNGDIGAPRFIFEEPHYFSQVPANIFYLQDEKSIFDCIMSLQDAYNEELTNEIDDYSSFCDAYMVLTDADIAPEDAQAMKEKRVLSLPAGADAKWLTKVSNDGQVENILKRIHESIYRVAQCPDFSNETFTAGVSSGIALRFRLCNMENRAAKVAAEMKKALQRRIELICGFTTLLMGEQIFRDIKITFKRNIPDDLTATINLVNTLKGSVSDATLLAQLPFIEDVSAELEALNKQKAENIALYGFGLTANEDNEDNEDNEE